MSAAPIGMPGCPDFAFSTASTARNLIVSTISRANAGSGKEVMRASWERANGSAMVCCEVGGARGRAEQGRARVEDHLHRNGGHEGAEPPLRAKGFEEGFRAQLGQQP